MASPSDLGSFWRESWLAALAGNSTTVAEQSNHRIGLPSHSLIDRDGTQLGEDMRSREGASRPQPRGFPGAILRMPELSDRVSSLSAPRTHLRIC